MSLSQCALLIVTVTLIGVAIGRYPWLRMNRATIALVGAAALLVTGVMTLEQAYAALDLNTLTLLFAIMILNVNLRLAGFFHLITTRVIVRWARSPRQLLALIIFAAGILSALFLNDTIVLMFTPLVVEITQGLKRNPLPYLARLATAANIGSAATITGNPQNMLIGIASGLSFLRFFTYLAPVAFVGMALAWGVIVLVYRDEFRPQTLAEYDSLPKHTYRPLLRKSFLATNAMLIAFLPDADLGRTVVELGQVRRFYSEKRVTRGK